MWCTDDVTLDASPMQPLTFEFDGSNWCKAKSTPVVLGRQSQSRRIPLPGGGGALGSERVPYGSERPYTGVKLRATAATQKRKGPMQVKGLMKVKGPTELNFKVEVIFFARSVHELIPYYTLPLSQ